MESLAKERLADLVGPLANFVSRRLRYYEALGDIYPGDLTTEDIVDLTYLKAAEHLRNRSPGEPAYRWLRGLAERILQREVGRIRAERDRIDRGRVARTLPELVTNPAAPVPDEVVDSDELQQALARVLGELPDSLREPFLLVVADGYSVEEAAAIEGMTPDAVIRRVAQASLILRDRLAHDYGDTDGLPLEQLFRLVQHVAPAPEVYARANDRLGEGA